MTETIIVCGVEPAKRPKECEGKRVLKTSRDVNRPAAMEQLQILGRP